MKSIQTDPSDKNPARGQCNFFHFVVDFHYGIYGVNKYQADSEVESFHCWHLKKKVCVKFKKLNNGSLLFSTCSVLHSVCLFFCSWTLMVKKNDILISFVSVIYIADEEIQEISPDKIKRPVLLISLCCFVSSSNITCFSSLCPAM